jgi:hypothetical protein
MIVVLLGPQRFKPTLGQAMAEHGVAGRVATITAGWQERESDDADLDKHLHGQTVNLRLHARGEEVFAEDAELKELHRQKQERLMLVQEFYRLRAEALNETARQVARRAPDADLLAEETQQSLDQVRELDRRHLERVRAANGELEARVTLAERRSVARHRRELAAVVEDCAAVAIAGGHVAVLLNRLKLFDIATVIAGRPVFAWAAGAMALTERVVLFHDSPPQGRGVSQILDEGLGLAPGVVALPSPRSRLRLDDRERVSWFARRYAPLACVALDDGARVTYETGVGWGRAQAALRLDAGGDIDTGWAA